MSATLTYLIATPHQTGSMFERAVVLLLEHGAEGAMGLVVSLQTDIAIGDLLSSARGRPEKAWLGGPVEPQIGWCIYEHATNKPGELTLDQRLHVTSSLEILTEQLQGEGSNFMLLLGYAGWGPGQLEEETRSGSWLWLETGPELTLDLPADQRWERAWELLGIDPATLAPGGAQA